MGTNGWYAAHAAGPAAPGAHLGRHSSRAPTPLLGPRLSPSARRARRAACRTDLAAAIVSHGCHRRALPDRWSPPAPARRSTARLGAKWMRGCRCPRSLKQTDVLLGEPPPRRPAHRAARFMASLGSSGPPAPDSGSRTCWSSPRPPPRASSSPALSSNSPSSSPLHRRASAVYLVNDASDAEADRAHPVKRPPPGRRRPGARRRVAYAAGALLAAAAAAAAGLPHRRRRAAGRLLVMQLAYCVSLKHVLVVDLVVVTTGFLMRAMIGGVALGIRLSRWFLITTGVRRALHGLRQALLRGRADGRAGGAPPARCSTEYTTGYLRFVWQLAAGVAVLALLPVGAWRAAVRPRRAAALAPAVGGPVPPGGPAVRGLRRPRPRGRPPRRSSCTTVPSPSSAWSGSPCTGGGRRPVSISRREIAGFALAGVFAYARTSACSSGCAAAWPGIRSPRSRVLPGGLHGRLPGQRLRYLPGQRSGWREYAVFFGVNVAGALVQLPLSGRIALRSRADLRTGRHRLRRDRRDGHRHRPALLGDPDAWSSATAVGGCHGLADEAPADRSWVARLMRTHAWRSYGPRPVHWTRLAAAMTFVSFLVALPADHCRRGDRRGPADTHQLHTLQHKLAEQVPGISKQLDIHCLVDNAGTVGAVGGALLLLTGIGWVGSTRDCMRAVWELDKPVRAIRSRASSWIA